MTTGEIQTTVGSAINDLETYQSGAAAAHTELEAGQNQLLQAAAFLGRAVSCLQAAGIHFEDSRTASTSATGAIQDAASKLNSIDAATSNHEGIPTTVAGVNVAAERMEGLAKGAESFINGSRVYADALGQAQDELLERFGTSVQQNTEATKLHASQLAPKFRAALTSWQEGI